MKIFKWLRNKPIKVNEAKFVESPKSSVSVGSTWGIYGINNNNPILIVDKVTNGIIESTSTTKGNMGKKDTQLEKDFLNCFVRM